MKNQKLLSLLLSAALLMAPLAACGPERLPPLASGSGSNVESSAAPDLSRIRREVDTGDASLDDPQSGPDRGEGAVGGQLRHQLQRQPPPDHRRH